jgi:NitT/TauT family transport system ATP-binding protein
LPIVEAGECSGFLSIEEGDPILKPLGQAYSDATFLARKELLAGRILRLPTITWIYETLKEDDTGETRGSSTNGASSTNATRSSQQPADSTSPRVD